MVAFKMAVSVTKLGRISRFAHVLSIENAKHVAQAAANSDQVDNGSLAIYLEPPILTRWQRKPVHH